MLMCVLVSSLVVFRIFFRLNCFSVWLCSEIFVMVKCEKCVFMLGKLFIMVLVMGFSVVLDDGVSMLSLMCFVMGVFFVVCVFWCVIVVLGFV